MKTIIAKSSRMFAFVALAAATGLTLSYAGSLTPPASPTKTMYSLEDIYNKLTDFSTDVSEGSGSFATPGSVSATMHSLSDIYGLLAAAEDSLVPGNIADGVEIFGIEGTLQAGSSYDLNAVGPFTDNDNGTVTDENSGLIWQDSDYSNLLCWDGDAGCTNGNGETAEGYGAIEYCDNLTYAGSSNWRLPTPKEWLSVADYTLTEPATTLPNIGSEDVYWTSYEGAPGYPIIWTAESGTLIFLNDDAQLSVRCVRNGVS